MNNNQIPQQPQQSEANVQNNASQPVNPGVNQTQTNTTPKKNKRLEFKFLNFFVRILRSVLQHCSTIQHLDFYFLDKNVKTGKFSPSLLWNLSIILPRFRAEKNKYR